MRRPAVAQKPAWSGLTSGRGSSRGGSELPRSSVRAGFGGGVRPGTRTLTFRPSPIVSSGALGSSGSPGIGLMHRGYSSRAGRLRFCGPSQSRAGAVLEARRVEVRAARRRIAAPEALVPGRLALLRRPVMARVGGVEVADGERGVERLLHVTVLETVLPRGAVRPGARVAVRLELERHRGELPAIGVEEPELGLDLVAVLVGDDVRDREVADGPPVALRAAGKRLVERAVVDVGRELLRDVDRVVAGAVRSRVVAHGAVLVTARARRGPPGGNPRVGDLRLGQAGRLERLRPVGVDVLRDGCQELLRG